MDSGKALPRQLTAVGTMVEANQLFTVYERNWNCTYCGQENYPARCVIRVKVLERKMIELLCSSSIDLVSAPVGILCTNNSDEDQKFSAT